MKPRYMAPDNNTSRRQCFSYQEGVQKRVIPPMNQYDICLGNQRQHPGMIGGHISLQREAGFHCSGNRGVIGIIKTHYLMDKRGIPFCLFQVIEENSTYATTQVRRYMKNDAHFPLLVPGAVHDQPRCNYNFRKMSRAIFYFKQTMAFST